MNIAEMIDEKLVSFDFDARTKDDVLKGLGKMMYDAGKVNDLNRYIEGLYEREAEFSTGVGNGVAIPHCKSDCVREAAFTLVKLKNPVEWETLDGRPVDYVIMLAAPNTSDNVHLKMLSKLAANLMDDDFRESLKSAGTVKEIEDLFSSKKEEE
ncbi:PTS sugar transporter subunit IIA [Faecalicatena sp. AGMB00832]|uniref:PTS sugar transporter subunit IIA n=1 Tax=Faecalicatena faecalis TaxID=2726362 RepID=A0ABS6DAP2_9FIRM|nr:MULTISPECIES: PTS sugar transporter subunit IIA [Faecalicatena]MBU3878664.1 PTS sugar transporter subunit IIA [Faecalicatena faecalis]MCI6466255.1 PTS sugar transporter subunit IIA [Faecalicatena sp.]MDY5620955.1 PTS sugar transporter subunit IIA [Lachnospiraceae bacterium]